MSNETSHIFGDEMGRKSVHASATPDPKVYNNQWEDHWEGGFNPGELWDASESAQALVQLLERNKLKLKRKSVLVPGCGRGYDVLLFAEKGCRATGLEISASAIEAAKEYRNSLSLKFSHRRRTRFLSGDFFSYKKGQFDIGYDYTFYCAIHPSMRADWAKAWARLIKKGGELITLLFPVSPDFVSGPPFAVDLQDTRELLEANGFECLELTPVDSSVSFPKRGGLEHLGRWIRK